MIVPCPNCLGRPLVDPFAQRHEPPCDTCDGHGHVDTESVCECGRPAVIAVADTMICTDMGCMARVMNPPKQHEIDNGHYMNRFV